MKKIYLFVAIFTLVSAFLLFFGSHAGFSIIEHVTLGISLGLNLAAIVFMLKNLPAHLR